MAFLETNNYQSKRIVRQAEDDMLDKMGTIRHTHYCILRIVQKFAEVETTVHSIVRNVGKIAHIYFALGNYCSVLPKHGKLLLVNYRNTTKQTGPKFQ